MLAMILYPDAQKRAQAELDKVVGRDRLPAFSDYEHLPYVRAMVKETLRWRAVVSFLSRLLRLMRIVVFRAGSSWCV